MMDFITAAKKIIEIRRLEEELLSLFSKGELFGTTHTSLGQEGIAVTLAQLLDIERDTVMSSHRCHGHYLAFGGPPELLLAEIMGRETGVCGGRGGSQHIKYKNFYSNGIQGGIVGNTTGMALEKKLFQNDDSVSVVFLGDGTLGEGLVYESFNFASKQNVPALFVIENNQYAQSTPLSHTFAGGFKERAQAFGISCLETRSNDPRVLQADFQNSVNFVRLERKPFVLVAHTYRLGPHSKGDDNRNPAEIEKFREFDPMKYAREILGDVEFDRHDAEVRGFLQASVQKIKEHPFSGLSHPSESVTWEIADNLERGPTVSLERLPDSTYLKAINQGLDSFLETHPKSFLMGEDILDPYGGAFKVTKGLSTKYPNRVIPTAISEAGLTGWATGAALRGARPIIEIMFSDFLSLGYDQLLNHASKYRWMYNGQAECPVIVRAATGGGRGYGPTHSQSIEKYFVGMQGLAIVAPSLFDHPGQLFRQLETTPGPSLFIEHKLLYPQRLVDVEQGRYQEFFVRKTGKAFPITHFSVSPTTGNRPVILTYGGMAMKAIEAARELMIEDELEVDVVLVSLLQPLQLDGLMETLVSADHLFVLEENDAYGGWGAEVISQLAARRPFKALRRIAARDIPLPSSGPLESEIIPHTASIRRAVSSTLGGSK